MELDKNLVNLQGTLYSFWMQGLLNRPDTLQQVLEGIKEVTGNVPDEAKSKLTFLMVLYTRLSVSEKLTCDNFVGQYINSEPYFKKEYLITYVYHLGLQQELFRVIENCPAPLGVDLLEEIIKSLKKPDFCKPEFGHEHFYQLWQSVFVKLCKLATKVHVESGTEEFSASFLNVYNLIQEVIIRSMRDDSECDGLPLYYFFKTLLYCIKLHKNPIVADDPLYELSIELHGSKCCFCPNAMADCIEKVFKKIPNILEKLTVGIWMFLSECYCSADPKNSIQVLVGDLVYNILKEVKEVKLYNVPSDVLGFLSSIAINKSELIAKAGIDEIVSNVKKGEKEWFKALVRHSAFVENESIQCLISHMELADPDDINLILNASYECLSHEQKDDMNLMKKLFLLALKETQDYSHWLVKIFENYRPNLLTTTETHEELIETFNKVSKGKIIPHSEFIGLCVQSPFECIKKICHIAVCSSEQTQFAVEILKVLKYPCSIPHFEEFTLVDYVLLKSLLEDLTDKEKQSFISLVVQLGKENILTTSFFNNLMKCLKEFSESELLEKAVICLEILKAILEMEIFEIHKAALLVFTCQVLGHFSWDLRSFSIIKADGREQTGSIIGLIMNKLEQNENGCDFQWAQQEILKCWEINQAYFCDLWFMCDTHWPCSGTFHSLILGLAHSQHKTDHLRNVLVNFDEPFEVRASIIISLTTLLPVLTFPKWNCIFNQLLIAWRNMKSEKVHRDVLDVFGSALQLLGMNLKRDEDTFPCYKYCLRNYGKLAKQCLPKMDGACLVGTFEKIFVIVGEIEDEEKRKCCWEIFSPLLMELAESSAKKDHGNEIEVLLPLLDLKDVAERLMKQLGCSRVSQMKTVVD